MRMLAVNLHITLLLIVYFGIIVKVYCSGNFHRASSFRTRRNRMLAVFTYADEFGFDPGLNSPEPISALPK